MEKTVKFSVFKEKIIKTNELLELHLKKTKELEKIQKCYQQLKRVLELNRNENKKLKLKNETVAYNLQLAEKNYGSLKEEFSKLKLQFNQLEDESSKTINNLQINYQLASQELKECKDKLSKFNEEQNVNMKQKSPAKKKKRVDIPSVDTGIINQKISQLTAEKQRLAKENDNLKLEMYELKKQLYKLQCFEDDPHTVKSMEKKLIEKQQELTDLKTKLKTIEENNVNEISRLAEELKHVKLGKSQVEIENEKLKNETCSFKIEISMLQENERQNMNEIKKMKEENETLVIENDTLKDMIRQNNATPCDDQIAAIMDEIATPTLLPPLNDFSELSPVNVPHVENAPICPVLEPKETSSSGDFVISSYTDITKTTKKPNSKKIRKILKKKPKKIDLFGALLALKQARINFVISSDLIHLDKISSPFIDNPCPAYTESTSAVTEKKHSDNLISKLSCNLPCCRNSLMLLKGDKSENAPLLGFCHVKDESYLKTEYFFDNRNCTKAIPSLKSPKKRKKFKSIGEKPLKRLTRHHENCSDDEVQHKSHQEQESENDPNGNYSAESIDPLKENVLLKTCDTNVKVDRGKKKESCSTVINSKKITQHKYTTRRSNSFDNTFGASTRKRIAHAVNQTKSVSQNVNNSFSPVKSSSNCKNLQNGREYGTCISSIRTHVDCSTNQSELISPVTNNQKSGEIVTSKITIKPKSPKTTFKRPLCGTRRSPRLSAAQSETQVEINEVVSEEVQVPMKEDGPPKCPESPTSENKGFISSAPKLIPLERTQENVEKMATTKIEVLFVKLINSSMEEEVLHEVVREFSNQNPEYIAQAILEKISKDFHDPPDSKCNAAPLMTVTQKTMLGFMSKLERTNVIGVFDSYLTLAERKLLTCPSLEEVAPITRLYLAICKLHHNIQRMRKLCCDVFYFCGDFAVPFLFYVLTSWSEVLPHEANSKDMPLAKVLVQIVYMKDCNKPGYNLNPLRDLLIKFYGYPTERWDSNELFQELFHGYLRNPVRSSDFGLLLFCKNHPEKWVYDKIEQHLKPIVNQIPAENFKAAVIILIGNLYNRFSSKSETNYLPRIREWFMSLVTETTPDVVKRSVYLCLDRLEKK